jgi:hypothetical protein
MVSPAGICDDKSHTTTIQVTGGLFVQGPANAFAEVGNVDFSAFAQQDAEISIK